MSKHAVHYSSGTDTWETPAEVYDPLAAEFGIELDAAADASNAKAPWFGPSSPLGVPNALNARWADYARTFWCNPPYSRGLQRRFVEKAIESARDGVTTVLLLPSRTDTKLFHDLLWDADAGRARPGIELRFLQGRIKFGGATAGAPFPSLVAIVRPADSPGRERRPSCQQDCGDAAQDSSTLTTVPPCLCGHPYAAHGVLGGAGSRVQWIPLPCSECDCPGYADSYVIGGRDLARRPS